MPRRVLAAAVLALGLGTVPLQRAAACDCAFVELSEAVNSADVVFVGTLVEHFRSEPGPGSRDEWHWSVERSRDADTPPDLLLRAVVSDGANCGVSFGIEERWLVLASVNDGVLETNGCLPNRRVDLGADPETEAIVKLMAEVEGEGTEEQTSLSVPAPLLVAIAAVAVIGTVAALAFRRDPAV